MIYKITNKRLYLIIGAIALNIVTGHLVQRIFQLPLFIDSIGTILVGALLGPIAGAITGILTNVLWAILLNTSEILPFAVTAAFIGIAAGFAAHWGAFKNVGGVLIAGFLTGAIAALISAPISAYVFGGITGAGTDYLTEHFILASENLLQATTLLGFVTDPLDKIISFLIVWPLYRWLKPHFAVEARVGTILDSFSGYGLAFILSLFGIVTVLVLLPAFESAIFLVFL